MAPSVEDGDLLNGPVYKYQTFSAKLNHIQIYRAEKTQIHTEDIYILYNLSAIQKTGSLGNLL